MAPIILCLLLPLSFRWSTKSEINWFFFPEMASLALILWVTAGIFTSIVLFQARARL